MRRLQLGRRLRFSRESLAKGVAFFAGASRRLPDELDGRGPGQQVMPGKPDLSHPPRAESLDQAIAANAKAVVEQLFSNFQNRSLTRRQRALENAPKLTYVAGPPVAPQPFQRFLGDDRNGSSGLLGLTLKNVTGELRQVVSPRSQRDEVQRPPKCTQQLWKDVAGRKRLVDVACARHDDAHVSLRRGGRGTRDLQSPEDLDENLLPFAAQMLDALQIERASVGETQLAAHI